MPLGLFRLGVHIWDGMGAERSSLWEKAGGSGFGHSFQSVTSKLQPPSSKDVLSF